MAMMKLSASFQWRAEEDAGGCDGPEHRAWGGIQGGSFLKKNVEKW